SLFAAQLTRCPGSVERRRNTGGLQHLVGGAKLLRGGRDLLGEQLGYVGNARAYDLDLALEAGMIDPVVETAALERVVQLPGTVGGQHDDRRLGRAYRAELGHGHLVR